MSVDKPPYNLTKYLSATEHEERQGTGGRERGDGYLFHRSVKHEYLIVS